MRLVQNEKGNKQKQNQQQNEAHVRATHSTIRTSASAHPFLLYILWSFLHTCVSNHILTLIVSSSFFRLIGRLCLFLSLSLRFVVFRSFVSNAPLCHWFSVVTKK